MNSGNNNGGLDGAPPTETSPLFAAASGGVDDAAGEGISSGTGVASRSPDVLSEAASEESVQSQRLWEELEKPWPSTYERSIALLSSPLIKPEQASIFTKSPKPGSTPLALARRRDLRKGYYTPEAASRLFPPGRQGRLGDHDDAFRKEMEKVKSLDFSLNKDQLLKIQREQEKKALEAKKYRAKILQQKDEEDGLVSPGYAREKQQKRLTKRASDEEVEALVLMDGKSTMSQCIFNLSNILMGVGLLALPFALKSAGWAGGLFSLVVFGVITWRTSILIGRELNGDPRPSHCFYDSPFKSPLPPGSVPEARMYPPISSFPDIARASFGEPGCLILSVILYFELFSCICIFFTCMGDHLHELFPSVPASTHILIVGAISIIPAIVLRTPALLSYLSMVGTCATIAVCLSVVASAFTEGDIAASVVDQYQLKVSPPYHKIWDTSGIALAFGLVAYCFSGHAILPSIYTSMKKPQEFETMVTYSFLIVMIACIGVGVSGYYVFGSTVLDQITLSLQRSSKASTAMTMLTGLMVLTGEFYFEHCSASSTASLHVVSDSAFQLTIYLLQPSPSSR